MPLAAVDLKSESTRVIDIAQKYGYDSPTAFNRAFSDSATLGICEAICASGMLVSSLFLGMRGICKGYVKWLSLSLVLAGLAMVGFGLRENLVLIRASGFAFFAMLPFANNCLDYLVRTNIAEDLQGRAWGLIGFLSQIGYVVAYSLSGLLADGMGNRLGIGVGRGSATVIMASGVLPGVIALMVYPIKAVRQLEKGAAYAGKNSME